uniref:Uncharacterized protein n=1 Tax=Heterorhabditis bacteriophora TaxID=37862 RepID=A0A1I7WI45_HETBA
MNNRSSLSRRRIKPFGVANHQQQ